VADLDVAVAVGGRGVDLAFRVGAGEVVAVLGPNGAGKSTAAAVIAGVLRADRAVVRVGRRTLTDTATGVEVAVHHRRVGLLAQEPLLFPHLTALGNVEFAARRLGGGRAAARTRARDWLARVDAGELAERKPAALSGGQARRVALARALAAEPDVLLLDEPLSGLDVSAASSVRTVLRTVIRREGAGAGRPVLLITHDLLDVLALADRVLVVESGQIAEEGSVAAVMGAPRSSFGARFAGVNVVRGGLVGPAAVRGPDGIIWHGITAEPLGRGPDSHAIAVFSPASVAVFRERPQGSPRNSVCLRVAALEVIGSAVRVRADEQADGAPGIAADITAESVAELRLSVGLTAWFTVKAQEIRLHAGFHAGPPEA
jgi:molybdate transport system ATP-binding protein